MNLFFLLSQSHHLFICWEGAISHLQKPSWKHQMNLLRHSVPSQPFISFQSDGPQSPSASVAPFLTLRCPHRIPPLRVGFCPLPSTLPFSIILKYEAISLTSLVKFRKKEKRKKNWSKIFNAIWGYFC